MFHGLFFYWGKYKIIKYQNLSIRVTLIEGF